jgi:hypothetical protein
LLAAHAAVVCLCLGCGNGAIDTPDSCDLGSAPVDPAVVDVVAIGTRGTGQFREVLDGTSLELVHGAQGGWMVVLVLRAEASSAHGDSACLRAIIDVDLHDGAINASEDRNLTFSRDGDYLYSPEVFAFLSLDVSELEGQPASLSATVVDDEHSAGTSVDITLVNEQHP